MNRRSFITKVAATGTLGLAHSMSISEQAEALEHRMIQELDEKVVVRPRMCSVGDEPSSGPPLRANGTSITYQMGPDPDLPPMPDNPTLIDFFEQRFAPAMHLLQSAALAQKAGLDEETVLACLLHDISVFGLIRSDHGHWGAQLVEPYVSERVSWAIRYHQALRFYPDTSVGYEYPEAYVRYFGADYKPEPHTQAAAEHARNHKWYMTARHITINDIYAFDPDAHPSLDLFKEIIGRHFKQPKEGLGYDGSPVAHMWRTIIFPTNFL